MKQKIYSLSFQNKSFKVVEWSKSDDANELILCLHGFGRNPEDFEIFTHELKDHERMVAIGFWSHEGSDSFTSQELKEGLSVEAWVAQFHFLLNHFQVENCRLLSYSMGGRFGLMLIQHAGEKITSAKFLASDGLTRNKLYAFTVGTMLGRSIANRLKKNASVVIGFARLLKSLKLLPIKLFRFVEFYMHDRKVREQVFDVWMGYRHCYPQMKLIAQAIEKNKIQTEFIFGKHDVIIPWKHGGKLRRLTSNLTFVRWEIVERGHRLM
ncbi:MAG: alpha/beta fold hydrolase [Sediminibacterium sp.]